MSKNDDELNEFMDEVTDGTICIATDIWYSYVV